VIAESIEPSRSNPVETGHDGSMSEFADIYACEHDRLVRLASLILGSTAVAEDVVQDSFAKLYGRLNRVDSPSAWLRTVVVNACRNEHRRWAVARRHAHLLAVDAVEQDAPVHELIDSLRSLPIRQRTVVVLRFYEDLPEADIADLLGIRIGTVKSRLHRALARLREEVER
jgi:RNA polymerase sigma-70 factor (sigma-E family)